MPGPAQLPPETERGPSAPDAQSGGRAATPQGSGSRDKARAAAGRAPSADEGARMLAPGGDLDQAQRPGSDPSGSCAIRPDAVLLLGEIAAATTRVPLLAGQLRGAGQSAITESAGAMQSMTSDVIAWASAEHTSLIEFFAQYCQSLEGGDVSGDALGLISLFNLFNPAIALRPILSIVALGAGYLARDYNRKLSQWKKSQTGRELMATGQRITAVDRVEESTWQEMFGALAVGSLQVQEVAVQRGELQKATEDLNGLANQLRGACLRGNGGGIDELVPLGLNYLRSLRAAEPEAWGNLAALRQLPGAIKAENARRFAEMKTRYIDFLASQGPIKVRGRVTYDGQSGGDSLIVELDSIQAVGRVEASGVSAETQRVLLERPGTVLAKNGAFELTADANIHTYESAPATDGTTDRGAPLDLSDTMVIQVTRQGATSGHPYTGRFPFGRIAADLLARQ